MVHKLAPLAMAMMAVGHMKSVQLSKMTFKQHPNGPLEGLSNPLPGLDAFLKHSVVEPQMPEQLTNAWDSE